MPKMKEEEKILAFWKAKRIAEKVRAAAQRKAKRYYFLDGPPYATGSIHMGTALNKILKDCFIRFFRMLGYNVWDQPGYDCHGLPIENQIEKKLGFRTKADIEHFGIGKFVSECRKFATQYIDVMSNQFANLGVWMDWKHPYLTLDNRYIEGAWWTFKRAFEKGLLYKGLYPVHVCPRCETAVAYNEIVYKNVADPSIYVKFKVKDKPNEYLLIWTTTPWTLPANTGIMAKPSADYVKIRVGADVLILAAKLLKTVAAKAGIKYEVIDSIKGKQLEGLEYEHPLAGLFPFHTKLRNAWRVVLSEQFVTLDEGTGLVHSAPGHGAEDWRVGQLTGLPAVSPVTLDGRFNNKCGKFSGIYVKDADAMLLEELEQRGLLLYKGKIKHEYPHCWRCESPLLLISVPQWFFKVTEIRAKLLTENKKVKWHPRWAGERFENWLENLGDWPISRQRYWGIPLPIWECPSCKKVIVLGSSNELRKAAKLHKKVDFHKPAIDNVRFKCSCGGTAVRVSEILDVWFDSGVASWASLGLPRNEKLFRQLWPADLNIEGPDQIRGWWNSQLITSIITFDKAPFNNILFHGFVLDAHGVKMSKSLGNVITPEDVIAKYGRDLLRFYLLSMPPWDDFFFSMDAAGELSKEFIILRNIYKFLHLYVKPVKSAKLEIEDRWLISKLHSLIEDVTAALEAFKPHSANRVLADFFANTLSREYIQFVRGRIQADGRNKQGAAHVLYVTCLELLKLLAPFVPFFTESAYQGYFKRYEKKESAHLLDWPKANKRLINAKLEAEMDAVKAAIVAILAKREKARIGIRWPLAKATFTIPKLIPKPLQELIKKHTNIKKLIMKKGKRLAVKLDTKLTAELEAEGYSREISRFVQAERKKAGLHKADRIDLVLQVDKNLEKLLASRISELKKRTNAPKLSVISLYKAVSGYKNTSEGKIKDKKIVIQFNIY